MNDQELQHYGILGMKWGIRRFQPYPKDGNGPKGKYVGDDSPSPTKEERKQLKTAKRHVSAAKRNLRWKGDTYGEAEERLYTAKENYEAANKKISLFRNNRLERIRQASEALSEAYDAAERPRSEMQQAQRIYDKAAKELADINGKLMEKYGSSKVKDLEKTAMQYGFTLHKSGWFMDEYTAFTSEVFKTGITVANLPYIGQYYTGKYIAKEELADREDKFNKRAKENQR